MKISHLGAKDCVTGSCHLIESRPGSANSVNILVDCGSAQGDDSELPFGQFPIQPDKIDYLFLTHAHIDYIGRVPDLIDTGFRGGIICTHATRALLLPMLRDAMTFLTRTDEVVRRLETLIDELSWGFELYETFTLKQGTTFKLSNAGHVLGPCFLLFVFPDQQGNDYRVIFSGDLGCTDTPILPAYSAHADQRMLVNWVRSMPKLPKEIRLVHGEAEVRRSLAKALGLQGSKRAIGLSHILFQFFDGKSGADITMVLE